MNWSYSAGRTFAACARRWFYRSVVAHHAAKDPLRREAYLLGKVSSLASWRGQLVDEVISEQAVPSLAGGQLPDLSELLETARRRFDAQLAFARTHRMNDPGLKPSREPDFLLLADVEAGTPPSEEELARLWEGVERALAQLLAMDSLLDRLRGARLLSAQHVLSYPLALPDGEKVTIRAIPDLLVFFKDAPPLIVDWKVSVRAATTHEEQLIGYALALSRSQGWSLPPRTTGAADTELLEVQLLTNERRRYELTNAALELVEVQAVASASQMRALLADHRGSRDPFTVPPTTDLKRCHWCTFKGPCWAGGSEPHVA